MSEHDGIEELVAGMVTDLDGSIRKELEASIERIMSGTERVEDEDFTELDEHRRMLWSLQGRDPESRRRCHDLSARVDTFMKALGVPFEGSFPVLGGDGSEVGVDPDSVVSGPPLPVGGPAVVLGSPDAHTAGIFDELVRTIEIYLCMPTDVSWQLMEFKRLLHTLVGDSVDRRRRFDELDENLTEVTRYWVLRQEVADGFLTADGEVPSARHPQSASDGYLPWALGKIRDRIDALETGEALNHAAVSSAGQLSLEVMTRVGALEEAHGVQKRINRATETLASRVMNLERAAEKPTGGDGAEDVPAQLMVALKEVVESLPESAPEREAVLHAVASAHASASIMAGLLDEAGKLKSNIRRMEGVNRGIKNRFRSMSDRVDAVLRRLPPRGFEGLRAPMTPDTTTLTPEQLEQLEQAERDGIALANDGGCIRHRKLDLKMEAFADGEFVVDGPGTATRGVARVREDATEYLGRVLIAFARRRKEMADAEEQGGG